MKSNVIFSLSSTIGEHGAEIFAPTFSFNTRFMPTQFTFAITIILSDFDQLDGNSMWFRVQNTESGEYVYKSEELEIPHISKRSDSITYATTIGNAEIENEAEDVLTLFVNDQEINSQSFVFRKVD